MSDLIEKRNQVGKGDHPRHYSVSEFDKNYQSINWKKKISTKPISKAKWIKTKQSNKEEWTVEDDIDDINDIDDIDECDCLRKQRN